MSKARFIQNGAAIDYTAGSAAVSAGDVIVQGALVGIANADIPANETGSISVEGVYEFDKTASEAITAGATVYWNATSGIATGTSAAGLVTLGKAVAAAGSGATVVKAKIN